MRVPAAVALFFVVLLSAVGPARAAPDPKDSASYFSHFEAPCYGPDHATIDAKCEDLKTNYLEKLQDECARVDEDCEKGDRLLRKLFGKGYRPALADFITYFRQKDGVFVQSTGVLMSRHVNTPHLYGVRDIYALVFSEKRICLDAFVSVDFKSEPNPFSGIFSALGNKIDDPKAAASTRTPATFSWLPLSGDPGHAGMWLGIARTSIDVNSVGRFNIQYRQPQPVAASKDVPEECTTPADPKSAEARAAEAKPADKAAAPYKGDFFSANAFFSNSPDSYVGVSFALGMTSHPKDTSVSTGDGSKQYYNGYAFAKLYAVRPELRAGPEASQDRKISYALVLGTNLTKSTFSEIVYGVSVGHILGNMGVIVGVNSLQGVKDSGTGRKSRPFLGLEYSF